MPTTGAAATPAPLSRQPVPGFGLVAVAGLVLVSLACAAEEAPPPRVQDWLGKSATEVPVIAHEYLPHRQREDRIGMVPDLIIAERPDDTRYAFGRVQPAITVDAEGRIFVHDPSNHRIAVFDAAGELSHEFGGHGEGPGEFPDDRRAAIGFRGAEFFAWTSFRLRLWDAHGPYIGEWRHRLPPRNWNTPSVVTDPDGRFIIAHSEPSPDLPNARQWALARRALADDALTEHTRYLSAPLWARGRFAAAPSGEVYAALVVGRRTEMVAFDVYGKARWIRTLDWPPDETIAGDVLLDGQGHLLWLLQGDPTASADRLVDILSPQGEILSHAKLDSAALSSWRYARGDFVYGTVINPQTFEWEVVRYRLELPF